MSNLKPCPFCGRMPELIDNSGEYYYRKNVASRPEKTFLRREMRSLGSRGKQVNFYVFFVNDWQVQCSTKGCFARNLNKHFHSKEEATEAWNRRC